MKLRIRELRQEQQLTQNQIAQQLQCDQSLYSKYEREQREMPLCLLIDLANFYEVSLDYLVCLSDCRTRATKQTDKT